MVVLNCKHLQKVQDVGLCMAFSFCLVGKQQNCVICAGQGQCQCHRQVIGANRGLNCRLEALAPYHRIQSESSFAVCLPEKSKTP